MNLQPGDPVFVRVLAWPGDIEWIPGTIFECRDAVLGVYVVDLRDTHVATSVAGCSKKTNFLRENIRSLEEHARMCLTI